ncbi:MAG: hypothetical protein NPIRA06_14070 [Nitrospirales bacterium]|nr:MAG: hypothetical protein NPIRA06_14070 [Nitrospirales bacterium]
MVLGCVGGPGGNEAYKKEGFHVTRPNPGARVVLRGNHVAAVNQAFHWLNDHQLLVVDRRVDPNMTAQKFSRQNDTERQTQFLAVDRMVGATLWVFAQVDETSLLNSTVDSMNGETQNLNATAVDIQGINAKTGEVMFGAKAWNSDPLVVTDQVIQDLTILALEQAWQKSAVQPSSQQEVKSEDMAEPLADQVAPVSADFSSSPTTTQSATVYLESSGSAAMAQSEPVESSGTSPEQTPGIGIAAPVSEEMSPVSVVTPPSVEPSSDTPMTTQSEPADLEPSAAPAVDQPADAENSGTSDDSSLGLQVASGALSILYTPVKVVYAGVGGIFGGFVYLVTAGNERAAQSVWDGSLKGDYWLTPDHLQGNEPVRFKGETTR